MKEAAAVAATSAGFIYLCCGCFAFVSGVVAAVAAALELVAA